MSKTDVTWHATPMDRASRWRALGVQGGTLWLTGLSGAGKSTIAVSLEKHLVEAGVWAYRLDGDNLRLGLNRGLGFSPEDRIENLRRVTEVAALFADAGAIVIASTISPLRAHRLSARQRHQEAGLPFFEVFVSTPVEVCRQRDPKGLYARADRGLILEFTGVSAPYEAPDAPDLVVPAHELSVDEACRRCVELVAGAGWIDGDVIGSSRPPPSRE